MELSIWNNCFELRLLHMHTAPQVMDFALLIFALLYVLCLQDGARGLKRIAKFLIEPTVAQGIRIGRCSSY